MDHDEILRGGPGLDRQERPVPGDARRRLPPSRVPETRPTPLQGVFIHLSIVVLACGVIAISALELGARLSEPVVRFPTLLGGGILTALTLDAIVRVWRSAWVWMPIDRRRGSFRLLWAAVLALSLVVLGGALWVVGTA